MYQYTGAIIPSAPFDFQQSLGFLGEFMPTHGEHLVDSQHGAMIKALWIGTIAAAFKVISTGTIDAPQIDYTIFSAEPLNAQQQMEAQTRITFFLSLDDDLKPFYAVARRDPCFDSVVKEVYGLHQVKFSGHPFENAAWAVLTQRNPIPMAQRMKRALIDRYGAFVEVDGRKYPLFPRPEVLAEAGEEALTEVIHHAQKAAYLAGVARAFATVDEKFLRQGDYIEVETWLRNIKGIGEWSAKFILIRGLGRTEHLTSEKNLLAAASKRYGAKLTDAQVLETAAQYGAYRGYWAYYLRATDMPRM